MNINPVSFGRIVKLNAPLDMAQNIAKIANNPTVAPAKVTTRQIRNLFVDSDHGDVIALNPTKRENISYLLSGSDAKKAEDIIEKAQDTFEKSYDFYLDEEGLIDAFVEKNEKANCELNKLIKAKRNVPVLNIIPDRNGEIKFLDLIN